VTAEVPEINEPNLYKVGSGEILGYRLEIDQTSFDSFQWQHISLSPQSVQNIPRARTATYSKI